ncbi:CCAAT/enhancer-binding protein alpha-like [Ornithodoros turicata]|uniref:Putative basic region leucine zipper transcription factor n=1 Tax=Ornithodoros turicata TaxID=34597 RepID=A0A2R5LI25_9ACAR
MDSPHLYETASADDLKHPTRHPPHLLLPSPTSLRPQFPNGSSAAFELGSDGCVPDLSELNSPELSFDLQGFIGDSSSSSHSASSSLEETLFTDLLTEQQKRYAGHYPMPHQGESLNHHTDNRYGAEAGLGIKQEPLDQADYRSCREQQQSSYARSLLAFPGLGQQTSNGHHHNNQHGGTLRPVPVFSTPPALGGHPQPSLTSLPGPLLSNGNGAPGLKGLTSPGGKMPKGMSKKMMDKASDEYRRRRERNNIAVRKSREKAKQRSRDTERKVSELNRENDSLRKKVELLTKELTVLKSLLTNVGVPPENVDSEIARSLQGY